MEPEGGDSGLPPITMEGAQTFGCLVNGEVFVNRPRFFDDNISMSYSRNFGDFNLSAYIANLDDQSSETDFIHLYSKFTDINDVELETSLYSNLQQCITALESRNFLNDDDNYLRISRLDNEEHIISGTFAFVVIDTICHDTFRITEGRFDYDYAN